MALVDIHVSSLLQIWSGCWFFARHPNFPSGRSSCGPTMAICIGIDHVASFASFVFHVLIVGVESPHGFFFFFLSMNWHGANPFFEPLQRLALETSNVLLYGTTLLRSSSRNRSWCSHESIFFFIGTKPIFRAASARSSTRSFALFLSTRLTR